MLKKIWAIAVDLAGGLFLFVTGLLLIFFYLCSRGEADNWFVAFNDFLFLFALGFAATVLGIRRVALLFRNVKESEES